MTPPFICVTRSEQPDDIEVSRRDWQIRRRDWYATRHAPELFGFGFLSARSFQTDGRESNCNIYELPDLGIFDAPAFREWRKADTLGATIQKYYTDPSRTIYRQQMVADQNGTPAARPLPMRGPILEMLRFAWQGSDSALLAWVDSAVLRRLQDVPTARTARLWQEHPLGTGDPAVIHEWCVVIDHEDAAPVGLLRDALKAAPSVLANSRHETMRKWYGLAREEPAPDRP